jgi:hypothetical protein
MPERRSWRGVCRSIDNFVSLAMFLSVTASFAFVAGMCLFRLAIQGWREAAFAAVFFGGMIVFCTWMAGFMVRGFLDWLRPERTRSATTGLGTSWLGGAALCIPAAIVGAIVPPSQEVFLTGVSLLGCVIVAALFSRVTFGILGAC